MGVAAAASPRQQRATANENRNPPKYFLLFIQTAKSTSTKIKRLKNLRNSLTYSGLDSNWATFCCLKNTLDFSNNKRSINLVFPSSPNFKIGSLKVRLVGLQNFNQNLGSNCPKVSNLIAVISFLFCFRESFLVF